LARILTEFFISLLSFPFPDFYFSQNLP
jgi:hypothetical protein